MNSENEKQQLNVKNFNIALEKHTRTKTYATMFEGMEQEMFLLLLKNEFLRKCNLKYQLSRSLEFVN